VPTEVVNVCFIPNPLRLRALLPWKSAAECPDLRAQKVFQLGKPFGCPDLIEPFGRFVAR
jgi:hypothetical protein